MSSQPSSDTRTRSSTLARVIVPSGNRPHRQLCYLLLMFPLGVVYVNLVVAGLATGLGLAIVGVGIPILVLVLAAATGVAALERTLVRALLGVEISAAPVERKSGLWARTTQLVTDSRTWKANAYLLSVFVFGSAAVSRSGCSDRYSRRRGAS